MAKSVFMVRVNANDYGKLEELLDAAGYDSDLMEEYEGDEEYDEDVVEGLEAIRENDAAKIKQLITNFVTKNYGQSEAENPSWDIDALAKYIVNKGE